MWYQVSLRGRGKTTIEGRGLSNCLAAIDGWPMTKGPLRKRRKGAEHTLTQYRCQLCCCSFPVI